MRIDESDQEPSSARPERESLPKSSLSLASEFYEWADKHRRRAKLFLITGLAIVFGGILLAIGLPPFLQRVDAYIGAFEPHEVTQTLSAQIKEYDKTLRSISEQRQQLVRDFKNQVRIRGTVWKRFRPTDESGRIKGLLTALIRIDNGTLYAVGSQRGVENPTILLLRRRPNDTSWKPIQMTKRSNQIEGRLYALLATRNRTLYAAGFEGRSGDSTILLLRRGPKDKEWIPIRPKNMSGQIKGKIFALQRTSDGTLYAAGYEGSRDIPTTLLLRLGPTDTAWTPIHPKVQNSRIKGVIWSIVQTQAGTLYVAGFEGVYENPDLLVLRRGSSHIDWIPFSPKNNSKRIKGSIFGLMEIKGGTIYAAAIQDSFSNPTTLLLRRGPKESVWTPIEPKDGSGIRIRGDLTSLAITKNGTLYAAGFEGSASNQMTLLLRRGPNDKNWKPIRPTDGSGRIKGAIWSILNTPNGTLYAAATNPDGIAVLQTQSLDLKFDLSAFSASKLSSIRSDIETLSQKAKPNMDLILSASIIPTIRTAGQLLPVWDRISTSSVGAKKTLSFLTIAINRGDEWQRISRLATRLAVIGLLIYLVQLMVNLYRYATRLAAFYKARGDAILLIQVSGASVKEATSLSFDALATSLSPDSVDFGKSPATPNQDLLALVRGALRDSGKQQEVTGKG